MQHGLGFKTVGSIVLLTGNLDLKLIFIGNSIYIMCITLLICFLFTLYVVVIGCKQWHGGGVGRHFMPKSPLGGVLAGIYKSVLASVRHHAIAGVSLKS